MNEQAPTLKLSGSGTVQSGQNVSFEIENMTYGITNPVYGEDLSGRILPQRADRVPHLRGDGGVVQHPKTPVERATFSFGGAEKPGNGYFVTDKCIGCKLCYAKCPQKCIDITRKPVFIRQENCLHCGNCYQICPARAVERRGAV